MNQNRGTQCGNESVCKADKPYESLYAAEFAAS